jgi:hypothetical protein
MKWHERKSAFAALPGSTDDTDGMDQMDMQAPASSLASGTSIDPPTIPQEAPC